MLNSEILKCPDCKGEGVLGIYCKNCRTFHPIEDTGVLGFAIKREKKEP